MAEKNIFEKIRDREVPAQIIYEDEKTLAFLDHAPVTLGHTLVIPKEKTEDIFSVDQETLCAVMRTVHYLAPRIKETTGADGVNIMNNSGAAAGQVVFYLHVHIIPRWNNDGFVHWKGREYSEQEKADIFHKLQRAMK